MKLSKELLKNLALLSNLGLIIISHILIAIALYKVIQKLIGFNSFLFVIFIVMGIIGAFYNIYKYIFK